MKYLITGGTGFIGQKLVNKLVDAGHKINILTRNPDSAKTNFSNENISLFKWDPLLEVPCADSYEGVDCVINLLGENIASKRWSKTQKKIILDSRVVSSQNLIKGINDHCKDLKTFISASAIGYYPINTDKELSETETPGNTFLSEVCKQWEGVLDSVPSDTRKVSLRIGVVLGIGGGALSKLIPVFKLFAGGPVGFGKNWMSWIHIDDLVEMIHYCAENPHISGAVNAVSPNPVTNAIFSKSLGKALSRPSFMIAPPFMLKLAMGEMSTIVLDSQIISSKKITDLGYKFKFPSIDNALKDLCEK